MYDFSIQGINGKIQLRWFAHKVILRLTNLSNDLQDEGITVSISPQDAFSLSYEMYEALKIHIDLPLRHDTGIVYYLYGIKFKDTDIELDRVSFVYFSKVLERLAFKG